MKKGIERGCWAYTEETLMVADICFGVKTKKIELSV